MSTDQIFLEAEWRNLTMLNYEADPSVLAAFIPAGTELDRWNGKVFVSLVGFRFLKTRVCGFSIPFHRNFDEVNLRFYVRRRERGEVRRGVVFIKEIVPRWAIAYVARNVYNERYVALPMRHHIEFRDRDMIVEYGWRTGADLESYQPTNRGQRLFCRKRIPKSNLSPNITGDTPSKATEPRWSIAWLTHHGEFGTDLTPDLKATRLNSMVRTWLQWFAATLPPPFSPRDRK